MFRAVSGDRAIGEGECAVVTRQCVAESMGELLAATYGRESMAS